MMSKKKKIIVGILLGIIILLLALGIFIGNFFYNYALNPNSGMGIGGNADYEAQMPEDKRQQRKENLQWVETYAEDTWLTSTDELKLHAYTVSAAENSSKYAILCHGYKGQANEMAVYARHFYEQGYHIWMPDARGHGQSEGNYIGMGWPERKDIVQWIESIVSKDADAQIVLMGVSMGGATVMMTSGEVLPSNVKAIVEDCGYTSVRDEFVYQLKAMFGLPEFPVIPLAFATAGVRSGVNLYEGSAVEQVKKCKLPMLFIHGEEDDFVPFYMMDEVYEAAGGSKEKLIVKGAEHAEAREKDPETYWKSVDAFLEKYIRIE